MTTRLVDEGKCFICCCPNRWAKPLQYLLIVVGVAMAIAGGVVYNQLNGKAFNRCSSTLYNNDVFDVGICQLACPGDTFSNPGTCWAVETWAMQLAIVVGVLHVILAIVTLIMLAPNQDSKTGLLLIVIINSVSAILCGVCAIICLVLARQSPAVSAAGAVMAILFAVALIALIASAHTTRTERQHRAWLRDNPTLVESSYVAPSAYTQI